MRFVRKSEDAWLFETSQRERALFLEVLRHYPLSPISHHRLTRTTTADRDPANQKLLEEAMTSQQQLQRSRVGELLKSKQRFVPHQTGYRVQFNREEMEWLLQVLNDVRVGSWIILGCPDPDEGKAPKVDESNAKYVFLMELGGHFEYVLIEALDGPV